jgi:extracellular elastinolytic metalloproteinase
MHDLSYHYGFTEAAGNFQLSNFGRGGKDKDPVLILNQFDHGFNNAAFQTPPDGKLLL